MEYTIANRYRVSYNPGMSWRDCPLWLVRDCKTKYEKVFFSEESATKWVDEQLNEQ